MGGVKRTDRTLSLGGGVRVPYPVPSSATASAVMKGNQSRDTRPEVAVRSALHRRGLRFRKDYLLRVDGRRYRPDIVFTRQRVAVFLDGCFWHGCPKHGRTPRANNTYWSAKLARNVARDRQNDEALKDADWQVVRLWEHESVEAAVTTIEAVVRSSHDRTQPVQRAVRERRSQNR